MPDRRSGIDREGTLLSRLRRDTIERICREIEAGIQREGFRSHEEFAHAIALPKSTLSRLLRGMIDPRLSTLERIAFGLGMDLVDLLRSGSLESREGDRVAVRPISREPAVIEFRVAIPAGTALPEWVEGAYRERITAKPRKSRISRH